MKSENHFLNRLDLKRTFFLALVVVSASYSINQLFLNHWKTRYNMYIFSGILYNKDMDGRSGKRRCGNSRKQRCGSLRKQDGTRWMCESGTRFDWMSFRVVKKHHCTWMTIIWSFDLRFQTLFATFYIFSKI